MPYHGVAALSSLLRLLVGKSPQIGTMLGALALVEELIDRETSLHQMRVAVLADRVAHQLSLPTAVQAAVAFGAMIHDIGKAAIASDVLAKPGELTLPEMRRMRAHPTLGFEMLQGLRVDWPVRRVVIEHHERMDGSGYPRGLSGDQICLESRVVAVADVVDSMLSHRSYRRGMPLNDVIGELVRERGRKYDTAVVDACLDVLQKGMWPPCASGRPMAASC